MAGLGHHFTATVPFPRIEQSNLNIPTSRCPFTRVKTNFLFTWIIIMSGEFILKSSSPSPNPIPLPVLSQRYHTNTTTREHPYPTIMADPTKRARLLTPTSDADGDSTMHSSPSLPDDDEMFPDEALPQTPAVAAATHATASDISPPNSQAHPVSSLGLGVNENGKRPLSLAQGAGANPSAGAAGGASSSGGSGGGSASIIHTDQDTGYTWSRTEDQPGYEWKNTRAREEESRALEVIVDKGLQIKSTFHIFLSFFPFSFFSVSMKKYPTFLILIQIQPVMETPSIQVYLPKASDDVAKSLNVYNERKT